MTISYFAFQESERRTSSFEDVSYVREAFNNWSASGNFAVSASEEAAESFNFANASLTFFLGGTLIGHRFLQRLYLFQ